MKSWRVTVQIWPDIKFEHPVHLSNGCILGNPAAGSSILYGPKHLELDSPYPCVRRISQTVSIDSDTYYWCEVEAANEDAARDAVLRRRDPLVKLALQFATKSRVQTTIISVVVLAERQEYSTSGSVAEYTPARSFESVDWHLVKQVIEDLSVQIIDTVIHHLRRGDEYAALTPSARELARDAALMEYAKAVEFLVRREGRDSEEDFEEKQCAIVEGLRKELAGRKSTANQVKKIRGRARDLAMLERNTVISKVEAFASRLDMTGEWVARTKALIKVRNEFLAHPGVEVIKGRVPDLNDSRALVVDALMASLGPESKSRCLRVEDASDQEALAGGPTLNWGPARRKVYGPNGGHEWMEINDDKNPLM